MLDLKKTTFIIPVSIESIDRLVNFRTTISYLCKHLNTNIIVLEYGNKSIANKIIKRIDKGKTKIKYIFKKNSSGNKIFHRTKFLNLMIEKCKTEICVNYDCDILLEPHVYKKSQDLILDGQDLVYPYFWGDSQHQVNYKGRDKIEKELQLSVLDSKDYDLCKSEYGHCQFFNTDSYKAGGMEDENYVSYAPEDKCRALRFQRLGYNVMWSDEYVFHLEHSRGLNSSNKNPMMHHNNRYFDKIQNLTPVELKEYYSSVEYLKKYR